MNVPSCLEMSSDPNWKRNDMRGAHWLLFVVRCSLLCCSNIGLVAINCNMPSAVYTAALPNGLLEHVWKHIFPSSPVLFMVGTIPSASRVGHATKLFVSDKYYL